MEQVKEGIGGVGVTSAVGEEQVRSRTCGTRKSVRKDEKEEKGKNTPR
jgi:hypothetical protein